MDKKEFTIEEALGSIPEQEAKVLNEKHSNIYILHYYRKARSHEASGKIKGDFEYYFKKLLSQDKNKFYEKENRKKEVAQKDADKKRKARVKLNKRLEESKNRDMMASEQLKKAKELFRSLPEVEQKRRIKREEKNNPSNSFHQNRDLAVITFHQGR